MRLWGRRSSFNVQKVLWCLAELGLEFEHKQVGGAHGGLDNDCFRSLNPLGKVPVLEDGDVVIWESHAIIRYLAASYSAGNFWPYSPVERSWIDRWMDWSQTALQPDFMSLFWGFYRTPADQRDTAAIQVAVSACQARYVQLAEQLRSRKYLAGNNFTFADIPAGTSLYRYFEMGVDVERPPEVEAWYARLRERPAFAENIMVPFSELKGREEF